MTKTLHGTVRGNTIELEEALGVPEGQHVEVIVRALSSAADGQFPGHRPGDGLLRTEGALANDLEWDAIMTEIHDARKQETRPQAPRLEEP
jgi:hypothetical protein